jgi:hypothetical protein
MHKILSFVIPLEVFPCQLGLPSLLLMLRMDIQLMVRDLPPDHHQPIARAASHPASEADRPDPQMG